MTRLPLENKRVFPRGTALTRNADLQVAIVSYFADDLPQYPCRT